MAARLERPLAGADHADPARQGGEALNGGLIVPDRAVSALLATNPTVRVVETPESNHFTCIVDPVTLTAIEEVLVRSRETRNRMT